MITIRFVLLMLFGLGWVSAQERVHLSDDFNDNRNAWPLLNDPGKKSRIVDGSLFVENDAESVQRLEVPVKTNPNGDYRISAKIKTAQRKSDHGFGITWGSDGTNYFSFIVCEKSWKASYRSQNETVDLVKWSDANELYADSVGNEIAVEHKYGNFLFYVNGYLLKAVPDKPLFGNLAGVRSEVFGTVKFDWLKIMETLPYQPPLNKDKSLTTDQTNERFLDDFNDNRNCWLLSNESGKRSWIEKGSIFIENDAKAVQRLEIPLRMDPDGDYRISLVARTIDRKSNHGFGIVWGSDNSDFFSFMVSNGYWMANYMQRDQTVGIAKWTKNSAIKDDIVGNEIAVEHKNRQFFFYANGTLLQAVPEQSTFGVHIGIRSDMYGVVAFDQIRITETLPFKSAGTVPALITKKTEEGTDVHCIAINRQGHIFAGTPGQGLWRSTDNGTHWSRLSQGLPVERRIQTIGIDSKDGIVVSYEYAVHEVFIVYRPYYGASLTFHNRWRDEEYNFLPRNADFPYAYLSTNYGDNWLPLCWKERREYYRSWNSRNARIGSMGTIDLPKISYFYQNNEGISIIQDSVSRDSPLDSILITGGELNRGVFAMDVTAKGLIGAGTTSGLYQSKDFGDTWSFVSDETMMDMVADKSGTLYGTTGNGAVRYTIDNGKTWTSATTMPHFVFDLDVSPTDILYAATSDGSTLLPTKPNRGKNF